MDMKEKLVEILREPIFPHELVDPVEAVADYLLDSGVTVQEWISVDERLPDPFVSVLVYAPGEAPLPTVHESYIADHDDFVCILMGEKYKPGEVTHWMPLPPAPKGE